MENQIIQNQGQNTQKSHQTGVQLISLKDRRKICDLAIFPELLDNEIELQFLPDMAVDITSIRSGKDIEHLGGLFLTHMMARIEISVRSLAESFVKHYKLSHREYLYVHPREKVLKVKHAWLQEAILVNVDSFEVREKGGRYVRMIP